MAGMGTDADKYSLVTEDTREADLMQMYEDDPSRAFAKLGKMVEDGFQKNFKKDREFQEKTGVAFDKVLTELGAVCQEFKEYRIQNEADKKALGKSIKELSKRQTNHENKKATQAHGGNGDGKRQYWGASLREWIGLAVTIITLLGIGGGAIAQIGP